MTTRTTIDTEFLNLESVYLSHGQFVNLSVPSTARERIEIYVAENGSVRICLKKGSAVQVTTFEEIYGKGYGS